MFRTILVPLDGSPLAEKALPTAIQIARRTGATLHLSCVLTPASRPAEPPGPPREEETALDLAAWRAQQAAPGTMVQTSHINGPPAPALAEHATSVGADLVVMTTHGRGPLSRFWLGSVTDGLLRRCPVPMLVLRPADAAPADLTAEVPVRRVVVPLDGSAFAETALGPATGLARLFGAAVELVHVVPPIPTVGPDGAYYGAPVANAALTDEIVRQAGAMLDRAVAKHLATAGLSVSTRVLVDERVACAVLDTTGPGDVIALASHARRPATRWLLGSVADKLIRGANVPVLVVRPTDKLA
jgi:nucleotide-binding universal stress UspA family protein